MRNHFEKNDTILIDGVEYSEDDVVRVEGSEQRVITEDTVWSEQYGEYIFEYDAICLHNGDYVSEHDAVELYDSNEYGYEGDCCEHANGRRCQEYHEDDYFVCEDCGYITHNDYYAGDGFCDDCHCDNDHGRVNSYGYAPKLEFFTKGTGPTFGVELEYEDANTYKNEGLNVYDSKHGELFYAKEDGSLDADGVEFVSHPFDLEWYVENKGKLEKFLSELEGTTHDKTGIHVHIGRKTLSEKQIENMVYLVNHNDAERKKLSGRGRNNYCKYHKDDENETIIEKSKKGRYHAINLGPDNTIEIRTFRNSRKLHHVLGRIELTMALVDYCKNKWQRHGFIMHCKYLSKKHGFNHLLELLKEKGFM